MLFRKNKPDNVESGNPESVPKPSFSKRLARGLTATETLLSAAEDANVIGNLKQGVARMNNLMQKVQKDMQGDVCENEGNDAKTEKD